MGLLLALQFLTILPIPSLPIRDAAALGRASGYFPFVGVLLGLALALVAVGAGAILPPLLVGPVVVVAWAIATGALHLDGLADSADGLLCAGRTIDQRRAILRDSHVGTFGVVALVAVLLVKAVALASVSGAAHGWALVAAAVFGRWAMVGTLALFPAPHAGLGQTYRSGAGPLQLVVASLTALAVGFTLAWFATATSLIRVLGESGPLLPLGLLPLSAAIAAGVAALAMRRLGGLTGDVHGAVCEITETLCLVAVAAATWH